MLLGVIVAAQNYQEAVQLAPENATPLSNLSTFSTKWGLVQNLLTQSRLL